MRRVDKFINGRVQIKIIQKNKKINFGSFGLGRLFIMLAPFHPHTDNIF